MQYLEDQFLSVVESDETPARIRIIRGNLVHNSKDTALEIFKTINELTAKYPELNGREHPSSRQHHPRTPDSSTVEGNSATPR